MRGARLAVHAEAVARMERSRALVDRWVAEARPVYGVTTGFGALCEVVIPPADTRTLQVNILMSHAAGVGDPLPEEVVRAVIAVRAADLAQGLAGVRPATLQALVDLLNAGVAARGAREGIGRRER